MAQSVKDQILEALTRVKGPDLSGNVVELGLVSDIVIANGKVYFSISVPAARAEQLEPLREAAERVVGQIDGIDKAAIWQAVAEQISTALDVDAERTAPASSASERLTLLAARHLGHLARNPAIPAILFSRELHAGNDGLRQVFQRIMSNRQSVFAAILSDGIASGEFREDIDTAKGAALILTVIQGAAMRWSLAGRSGNLEADGQAMLILALDGFRPGPA